MGRDAEERLLAAMQGDRRALLDHAEAVEQVGRSMQRISRRIRRTLVQGSTEMWTGPGADEARAAFGSLADETETRGRTYEQAARPMREAARAITQSREDYDTLPNPWGVRANPGLIGDGGFQDAEQMNDWVAEQRAALATKRQEESARHYRSYSASMTAAADDLESTLPRRSGEAPPVDTSVTTHAPSGYSAPSGNGWMPGSVGGPAGGGGGGGFVAAPPTGGPGFGGLDGVPGDPTDPHPPTPQGPDPDGWPDRADPDGPGSLGPDADGPGSLGPGSDGPGADGARPDGRGDGSGSGHGGLATGLGIGAGVAAVGAVGLGIGMSRGRSGAAGTPGGLLASAAGARGDGRGAGGRDGTGGRGAVPVGGVAGGAPGVAGGSGGRGSRGPMVPVTGMAGPAPTRGSGRGAGGAGGRGGVPVTGAGGRPERDDAAPDQHWAVEDDWFGEDEAGPPVLR